MRVGSVENIGNRPAGQYIDRLLRQGAGLGYLYHSLCFGVKIVKRFQAPSLFGASHRFTRFFISSPKPRFSVSRFRCRPAIPGRAGSRSPSARKIRKRHHGQTGAPSQWEGCARHPNRTPRATRKNKAQEGIGKGTSLGRKAVLPHAEKGIKKGQTLRSDLEEAATYSPTGKPQYHRR